MNWKNHDPGRDIAILRGIFYRRPKILAKLTEMQINVLCVGAGMMHLWGTNHTRAWLPEGFALPPHISPDVAARMLMFHAQHLVLIEEWRASGTIKEAEIIAAQDSCESCKSEAGKRYKLDELPELPHPSCTFPLGCRCVAALALDELPTAVSSLTPLYKQ